MELLPESEASDQLMIFAHPDSLFFRGPGLDQFAVPVSMKRELFHCSGFQLCPVPFS